MALFSEMMDEAAEKDRQIGSLHVQVSKLQSSLADLCALMEADIEAGKVTGTDTRLSCLVESRSLLNG